jgi:hypothetical protein
MLDQKPAAALALRPASSGMKGKACRRFATQRADKAQRCLLGCMQTGNAVHCFVLRHAAELFNVAVSCLSRPSNLPTGRSQTRPQAGQGAVLHAPPVDVWGLEKCRNRRTEMLHVQIWSVPDLHAVRLQTITDQAPFSQMRIYRSTRSARTRKDQSSHDYTRGERLPPSANCR